MKAGDKQKASQKAAELTVEPIRMRLMNLVGLEEEGPKKKKKNPPVKTVKERTPPVPTATPAFIPTKEPIDMIVQRMKGVSGDRVAEQSVNRVRTLMAWVETGGK